MLSEPLRKRMRARASAMHVSIGELVRLATETFLNREECKWSDDPLAGNDYVITIPTAAQVSENVDRYLYGDAE